MILKEPNEAQECSGCQDIFIPRSQTDLCCDCVELAAEEPEFRYAADTVEEARGEV